MFVTHFPVFGGPHNEALRLADPLGRRGWTVEALLPEEAEDAERRLASAGIPTSRLPLHRLRASRDPRAHLGLVGSFPLEVRRIRRLFRSRRIDLAVVTGLVNPHAAVAARAEDLAVVWKIVDSRPPPFLRRTMFPLVERLADVVMFDGQRLIPLHVGTRSVRAASIVYYPPVDTDQFRPSPERREATRRELGVSDAAPVVGMTANLNPQKGVEWFIRAAGILRQQYPDALFLVIGAGYRTHDAYLDALGREVEAAGLGEGLRFVGERTDLERWYPAMDVKVISSVPRSEGTTTTALEAMSCGVPVVATDVGAVSEVVEDGVTGRLVPALDATAIAAATQGLLGSPRTRTRMGEAARRRAIELSDREVVADLHVRAFEAARRIHSARGAKLAGQAV
jgi:glycosyltransferase involved in cell wall biosynthesis